MHNLLSSERVYVYYLALICDIHIPAAQGRLVLMNLANGLPDLWRTGGKPVRIPTPATPISVNSRLGPFQVPAVSSITSGSSINPAQSRHLMTSDDVCIVFRNISDIASYSSQFAKRLETVFDRLFNDGDSAEAKVGELFLEIVR